MFTLDATPRRTAPALHVDAATVEKRTSPSYSEDERSPQVPSSSTHTEPLSSASVGQHKLKALRPTTFTRTNLAVDVPRSPAPKPHSNHPSNGVSTPPPGAESPSPARVAPSPVRSILDFYLGVSPSPRRPSKEEEEEQAPHSNLCYVTDTRGVERREGWKEGKQFSRTSSASSASNASASKAFHRSPAPARNYLDEFLAADDDSFSATLQKQEKLRTESMSEGKEASDVQTPRLTLETRLSVKPHVVGVAMDHSPVVPQMWEETGSSDSDPSSMSSSYLVEVSKAEPEPGTPFTEVEADLMHNDAVSTQPSPASTTSFCQHCRARAVAETGKEKNRCSGEAMPTGAEESVEVERALQFPAMSTAEEVPLTSVPHLTSSFSVWKDAAKVTNSPQESQLLRATPTSAAKQSEVPSPASPQPEQTPPLPAAPVARVSLHSRGEQEWGTTPKPTSLKALAALSALLQHPRETLVSQKLTAASSPRHTGEGPQQAVVKPFMQAHADVTSPAQFLYTSKEPQELSRPVRATSSPHRHTFASAQHETPSADNRFTALLPDTRRDPTHGTVLLSSAAAAAPAASTRIRRRRSVVARLYPNTSTSGAQSDAHFAKGEHDRNVKSAEPPRWNVSTKIHYNCLTEGIETTEDTEKMHRARSRAALGDYAASRAGSRSRGASPPSSSPPPPPALQTRTTLPRLQAMSARKAEEAARLEEELHPSFRPELAPRSARICREKLRELQAAETKADSQNGKEEHVAGAPDNSPSLVRAKDEKRPAGFTSSPPCDLKSARGEGVQRNKSRSRSIGKENSVAQGQPVGKSASQFTTSLKLTRTASQVSERLFAEAEQRKARQQQRQQEHEREMQAREQAERQSMARSSLLAQQDHVSRRSSADAHTEASDGPTPRRTMSTIEAAGARNTGGTRDSKPTVLAAAAEAEATPVMQKHEAITHAPTPNHAVPRVDLYSVSDNDKPQGAGARKGTEAEHRQRVEDRLLALEEDRRRRLYLMRHYADMHEASTGQKLFMPFTGR